MATADCSPGHEHSHEAQAAAARNLLPPWATCSLLVGLIAAILYFTATGLELSHRRSRPQPTPTEVVQGAASRQDPLVTWLSIGGGSLGLAAVGLGATSLARRESSWKSVLGVALGLAGMAGLLGAFVGGVIFQRLKTWYLRTRRAIGMVHGDAASGPRSAKPPAVQQVERP